MPRSPRYVLAIDLGGSRVRCAIVDLSGRIAGQATAEWAPESPPDLAPMGKRYDPKLTWRLIARLCRGALLEAKVGARDVVAVSATSQREGIALLDAEGREVYLGPNSDARAFFEGQAIDEAHSDEVYRVTGHGPSLLLAPAKLRWHQAQRPDVFERARTVMSLDAWVTYRLSGARAMERTSACECGLVDVRSRGWALPLLSTLGLPDVLPALASSGDVIGKVTTDAARATGLARDTPVVAAGPDTQCGLLGMGVTHSGQVGIVAGSTAPVQMVLDKPRLDRERRTWTGLHVLDRRWVLEANAGDAGGAYAWAVNMLLGTSDATRFALADRLMAKAPAGGNGVLAYLGPRKADMRDLGPRFGGWLFPTPFAAGAVERGSLIRAAIENLAYALKSNLSLVEEVSRGQVSTVAVGGGLVRSATFCKVLAAVLNREMRVPRQHEVTALGAAMAAAVGSGAYATLAEAAQVMAGRQRVVAPDELLALEYEEHFERWRAVGEALKGLGEYM